MKRKATGEVCDSTESPSKRRNTSPARASADLENSFRSDLFEEDSIKLFASGYAESSPYLHAVVPSLIEPTLLRRVRKEVTTHVSFTLKETDIYRIHQSGDLSNLSDLDTDSLAHLPSLVQLRDALYSDNFRAWISSVTGAGKLSGKKTDMAINIYTPGSYLLCHDDVIGSRRVSYILYLTDPDNPWKPEWGGGLRLYPTETKTTKDGEQVKVPLAEHSLNIPPSFGQLSFFAVRPGESYHDVEEVYHSEDMTNGSRIRVAISGWYHIPQEGEDGFEAGAEEIQAQKSSLAQLKGAANEFDEPKAIFMPFEKAMNGNEDEDEDDILTEEDLTFLLTYIAPGYLTPNMIENLAETFVEDSTLQLESFLSEKYARALKEYIESRDGEAVDELESQLWRMARPPHKHRFVYGPGQGPIRVLLKEVMPSRAFQKWLALITNTSASSLLKLNAKIRRFRRGRDYALASAYQREQPQLEFTIGLTPSSGWDEAENLSETLDGEMRSDVYAAPNGGVRVDTSSTVECGGEEVYMAGEDEDDDAASTNSKSLPPVGKKAAYDPAVYKSANEEDDDGILFTNTPSWNTFSIVLRDKGTLRFVKYVSAAAKGDRWDVKGEVELADDAFDADDEQKDDENGEEDDIEGFEVDEGN